MSSNSPTAVTAHTIIDKLCRDNVHVRPQTDGGPAGMGTARSRAVLRRAWGVLNKWALEILTERGTIDVPNFVRVGWQRFRRLDGQMRLRPVFILSEGFCRSNSLPHKRILRPPIFKKAAEVVNYTKLAIRYTSSMTKDMIFSALREIIREIGAAMATGAPVSVAFSFGVLESKDRTFSFRFDGAALSREGGLAPSADTPFGGEGEGVSLQEWKRGFGGSQPSTRSQPSPRESLLSEPLNTPKSSVTTPIAPEDSDLKSPCSHHDDDGPHTPDSPDSTADGERWSEVGKEGGRMSATTVSEVRSEFSDEVERERAREIAAERGRKRGSGRKTEAQDKAWKHAFRNHVTALEGQAEDDQNLAISIDNLNRAAERRAAEERDNKQREMHDLLTFVQGQIHEKEDRRAMELEANRSKDQPLTFSARRDRARLANACFEGTAWRAPDWGPRRARAHNLSREELLSSLQRQIRDREEERLLGRENRLAEEKKALEQLDRDYDKKERRKMGARAEALQELKRSWEGHVHLKELRSLAKAGPVAVREYALGHNIITNDEAVGAQEGDGGRAGWLESGPRSITGPSKLYMKGLCKYRPCADYGGGGGTGGGDFGKPRRPHTTRSEASSVGFDSRRCARGC